MGLRYLGNIIRPGYNPLASNITTGVNTAQYQGVFTLQQQAQAQNTQAWTTDPIFDYTTLLLQSDNAANGSQNNTFLDSSSNAFAITRNGNTTQGTFTPFSSQPGAWSAYLNPASSGYASIPYNAAFDFGTGSFTVEFWAFFPSQADKSFFGPYNYTAGVEYGWNFQINGSGQVVFYTLNSGGGSAKSLTSSSAPSTNAWHHIAAVRDGSSNATLYIDGVSVASSTTFTNNIAYNGTFFIGGPGINGGINTPYLYTGYLSNIRVVKGAAVYTSAFTPPTAPLGATSGGQNPPTGTQTSLLTMQSNRFVDNGGLATPNVITPSGSISVQAFSPFAPTAAYSAATVGGSGYFDGSDSLTLASNTNLALGSGDFEVSFWLYPTTTTQRNMVWSATGSPAIFMNSSRQLQFDNFGVGAIATSTNTMNLNAWNHCVASRVSGTLKLFTNGAEGASVSNSTNWGAALLNLGFDNGVTYMTGYMSGIRIVKGSGVTSVTVPTAPPTAITNTQLLTNFTNAGIYDGTMKNNLETVGNAQVSTAVVKYGSGSMFFDGTGDYLSLPVQRTIELGSSDWTFETWVYMNAVSSQQSIIYLNGNTSGYAALNLQVQSGALNLWLSANGSSWSLQQNTIGTIAANAWNHIAVVKVGTNIKVYINGTNVSGNGYTVAASLMTTYTVNQIGVYNASSYNLNGYLDDMRLTLGIARYTQNFIPPSVALPRQ